MRFVSIVIFFSLCLIFGGYQAALASPLVAVDPGHGGWDSGAVGPGGLKEKDVNLDIGLRLKSLLQGSGYGVVMTRETDTALGPNLPTDLAGRVNIANQAGANIFVSVHNNSFSSPGAGGTETYYYANPSTGWYNPESKMLAEFIQQAVVNRVGRFNRGAKSADFYVLRNTAMVAVLVEGLFLSNPTEEAMLNDPAVRQAIAVGIYEGINNFYGVKGFVEKTGLWFSSSTGVALSPFQQAWISGDNGWSWSSSKLTQGDFDGDGRSDLAVLYGYPSTRQARLWVFRSSGSGFNPPQLWWDSGPNKWDWAGSKLVSGDFGGDAKSDIAVFYGYPSTRQTKAWVFTSTGGAFNTPQQWWDSGPGNWDWSGSGLIAGNFNGVGKSDIAVLYGYPSTRQTKAWVFTSTGGAFNTPGQWWDSGPNNWDPAGIKLTAGDFDGNGRQDIAVLYGYPSTRQTKAWVFTSTGGAFNTPGQWWDSGPNNWDWLGSTVVAGKFNNDSYSDLTVLYGYFDKRQTKAWVFTSTGGAFNTPGQWWDSGPGNWEWPRTSAAAGDFNNDGIFDLFGLYNYGN